MSPDQKPMFDNPLEAWLHGTSDPNDGIPRATPDQLSELLHRYADKKFLIGFPNHGELIARLDKLRDARSAGVIPPPRPPVDLDELRKRIPNITFGGLTDDS